MSATWFARNADRGFCAWCGEFVVEAFICLQCSLDFPSGHLSYERRSVTATQIGRALQRRVDAAAAYEQLIDLQTVIEAGVRPVDESAGWGMGTLLNNSARAKRLRAKNYRASGGIAGPKFFETIRRTATPGVSFNQRTNRHKRHHARWSGWLEAWGKIGWQVLDDATRPEAEAA